MIPRAIHQFWFQGADQVPPPYQTNMQRLRHLNPGWRHRVWSDADMRAACEALGPRVLEAYHRATSMHQKIDLGRMCVLYVHGGITVDMDTLALRPIDSLPGLDGIDRLAVSLLPINSFEAMIDNMQCLPLHPGRRCSAVNNACLLAPPRDPALLHIIWHCAERILRTGSSLPTFLLVNDTTGPKQLGEALLTLPSRDMVIVLPSEYFEPCIGLDAHCAPSARSILYHQHDNSWMPAPLTTLFGLWYHLKHYWPLVLGAALVACVLRRRL